MQNSTQEQNLISLNEVRVFKFRTIITQIVYELANLKTIKTLEFIWKSSLQKLNAMTPIDDCVLYLMVIFICHFGILNIVRKLNIKNVCRGLVFHTIKDRPFIHAFGVNWSSQIARFRLVLYNMTIDFSAPDFVA